MKQETKDVGSDLKYYTHEDGIQLSFVIPCKDKNDPKLALLIEDIYKQKYPRSAFEILTIEEGTSESAKAIGIKKAKGGVICVMASDNRILGGISDKFLNEIWNIFISNQDIVCAYPLYYGYFKKSNFLNRYFALIGGNDPLSFYLCKNDKKTLLELVRSRNEIMLFDVCAFLPKDLPSLGDNMFFMRKATYEKYSDFDNFYHVDSVYDVCSGMPKGVFKSLRYHMPMVMHDTTDGNVFNFLKKRYHYGLQHAFNSNRHWHLVDFRKKEDVLRLIWFILASVTFIHPLILSIRGYFKIRDIAWFAHPIMCFLTLVTYAILVCHLGLRRLYQSLFARMAVQRA